MFKPTFTDSGRAMFETYWSTLSFEAILAEILVQSVEELLPDVRNAYYSEKSAAAKYQELLEQCINALEEAKTILDELSINVDTFIPLCLAYEKLPPGKKELDLGEFAEILKKVQKRFINFLKRIEASLGTFRSYQQ